MRLTILALPATVASGASVYGAERDISLSESIDRALDHARASGTLFAERHVGFAEDGAPAIATAASGESR